MVEPDRWRAVVAPDVKRLFGRPLRVLLASWFLANDMSAAQLNTVVQAMAPYGEFQGGVGTELRTLAAAGMFVEVPDKGRVYFTPQASPLWDVYRLIANIYEIRFDKPTEPSPSPSTASRSRDPGP